jgi:predicted nucleotidyltransferase
MLTKDNNYKIMGLFFRCPEKKLHIRQISRLTGLSAPGVAKIVLRLKKGGLLASERGVVTQDVYAIRSGAFLRAKACYNLQVLHESGLLSFLKREYEEPEAIVLFGSFAKGEDTSESDVDIAVVTGKELSPDIKKYGKLIGRKVNIYGVKLVDCEKEFLNNLANGVVLHGYLRLIH